MNDPGPYSFDDWLLEMEQDNEEEESDERQNQGDSEEPRSG